MGARFSSSKCFQPSQNTKILRIFTTIKYVGLEKGQYVLIYNDLKWLACLFFVPLLAFEDELRSPGNRVQYEDWRPGAEQRGEEHLDTRGHSSIDSIVTCRNVSEQTSKM